MPKFTIDSKILVSVVADGKVRISISFADRLIDLAKKCAKSVGTVQFLESADTTNTKVSFYVKAKGGFNEFIKKLNEEIKLATEYGPESDVLNMLLAKHPHLRTHPRVNELVGTFDMMVAKIQELELDTKSKPAHKVARPEKPGPSKKLSNQQLVADREEKLKGQAPDQRQPDNEESDIKSIITPQGEAQGRLAGGISVPETGTQHGNNSTG
jgi:hypothetical protein